MNIGTAVTQSSGPDILDNITAERRIDKAHSVTCSSKFDDSDSGPEEVPVLRESSGVQENNTSSFSTCIGNEGCSKNNNFTENPRKRRRHHKHNSFKKVKSTPNKERESVCYEKKSSNKSAWVRQRKLTLLEKVNKFGHYANFLIMC
jgi:hypothetical protein